MMTATDTAPLRAIGQSILIVEDDTDIRESLRDFLEFEGFKVYSAANGQEALDILETIPRPCLIFLDLFMPVMNGLEFLKSMKRGSVDQVVGTPIVVVSAAPPESDIAKQVKPLTSRFIKKPADLDLIIKIVESCGCYRESKSSDRDDEEVA